MPYCANKMSKASYVIKMSKVYCVSFPGQGPELIKGELKPIEIYVVTRSGNKNAMLFVHWNVYTVCEANNKLSKGDTWEIKNQASIKNIKPDKKSRVAMSVV